MGNVRPLKEMPKMTASQLITALGALVAEHGDLPVVMWDDSPVREVSAYDADGNLKGKRTEIVLHGTR